MIAYWEIMSLFCCTLVLEDSIANEDMSKVWKKQNVMYVGPAHSVDAGDCDDNRMDQSEICQTSGKDEVLKILFLSLPVLLSCLRKPVCSGYS